GRKSCLLQGTHPACGCIRPFEKAKRSSLAPDRRKAHAPCGSALCPGQKKSFALCTAAYGLGCFRGARAGGGPRLAHRSVWLFEESLASRYCAETRTPLCFRRVIRALHWIIEGPAGSKTLGF